MKIIDNLKIDKVIEIVEQTGFPIFATDIEKDERDKHSSFFIYTEKGRTTPGEVTKHKQYLREFILSFITKENVEIEEIELTEKLRAAGLIFRYSDTDFGKIRGTDQDAQMHTLTFVRSVRVF